MGSGGLDNFKVEASDEDVWKLLGRYFVSFCILFDSPGDFQKSILHISPRGFPISPGPESHDIPERSCGWLAQRWWLTTKTMPVVTITSVMLLLLMLLLMMMVVVMVMMVMVMTMLIRMVVMMCNNMIVINDDRNDHSNDDGNDDSNDDSNGNSNGDGDVDDANAFHETPMQPRY